MTIYSLKKQFLKYATAIILFFLNGLVTLFRFFVTGWRWWVGGAVVGALLLVGYAWLQPAHYRSEGTLTITPRFVLEGYMLATQELTHHYGARLEGDARIARAMVVAGTTITPTVEANSQPGMVIGVTVVHPDAAVAEDFTRALMVDLRNEILGENRTRGENDRLQVEISPTSFAQPVAPAWEWYGIVGALGGFVIGILLCYLQAWWGYGRVHSALEAQQTVAVPLLGMIPRR